MDMELIDIAIYVCASLGGVLLFLCIILAAFFIYGYCIKHFSRVSPRQYVIVPTSQGPEDQVNGQIILRKFSTEDLEKNGILQTSLKFEDESDAAAAQKGKKNVPPVKKKMLWKQKKKSYQQQSIPFQQLPQVEEEQEDIKFKEEELKVPKERLFKSKLQPKRRSKSDWELYDSSTHSSKESLVKGLDSQQSQYFDALETIEEFDDDDDESLSDLDEAATLLIGDEAWEDLPDSEDEEPVAVKSRDRHSLKRKGQQPEEIKRRVKALKMLQLKQKVIETKFYAELYELEASKIIDSKDALFDKRRRIINEKDEFGEPGIEGFWLQAMDNCENLKDIIQLHDRPILKHLLDIRIKTSAFLAINSGEQPSSDQMGFRVEFHFTSNPFFENKVLFKDYALRCELDMTDPWAFEGPEVYNCKGCKISWHKGKNATLRPVRKLKDGQIVTKFAKRNSFFNFFTPPKMTRETMMDSAKRSLFDAHFQIGLYLKETFVPKAFLFFLNIYHDHRDANARKFSNTSSNNDITVVKSTSKAHQSNNASPRKTPIPKPSSRPKLVIENQMNGSATVIPAIIKAEESDTKSAIIEVLPPPAADPIVGKYRLLKTENFDEFMKKLGVGLVKRKLANSVSPLNVIMVNDDGSYTVRTETTVRTTELNFQLGVPFKEETLDGRVTNTTATRVGNVLTLDQKGDPDKGELDSKQIRDFQGDKMLMSLVAQDVVCLRHYEKMKE